MRLRRFLTVLVCLSTLAFAQNVVAGTSLPESSSVATLHAGTAVQVGGEVPGPSSMMLFVCGIAGLTAAGGRRPEIEDELV